MTIKADVKALIAAALAITMFLAVVRGALPGCNAGKESFLPCWTTAAPVGQESANGVADFVFGNYVLPFEILSVLLLVALVAAIFLAQKEPEGDL